MAIWQYRLTLIPESALLAKYEILPSVIPMELAEESGWWSDNQPMSAFEQQISLILPKSKSWSAIVVRRFARCHARANHDSERLERS
jgi:hypothetical protein